jgi:uncharacterized protein (TIGR03492 family)
VRRVLFVANGHGETAIAARIAAEVARLARSATGLDLFPVVGTGAGAAPLALVGPRRAMPSGGLVAMGNVRAFSSDLAAGFAGLFARQIAFLATLGHYDAVVAVGDAYALALALVARRTTVFVGTAKSVYVAPYGPFERVLLRRAAHAFVRDAATAERLRGQGVAAAAPGNVIVDLIGAGGNVPAGTWLGLLPGSRPDAYADGIRLAAVLRALGPLRPGLGGLFSIAPTLDAGRFAAELAADGWDVGPPATAEPDVAFHARSGASRIVGWRGDLGAVLRAATAVLGQAGTANEQAAASGVPVIALDGAERPGRGAGADWYRMRQRRLLGEALLLVPPAPSEAARAIAELLADDGRIRAMSAAGRERMGAPGGATAIARAVLELVA